MLRALLPGHAWGEQVPPPGSQVDHGHPLAQGVTLAFLFNETQVGNGGVANTSSIRNLVGEERFRLIGPRYAVAGPTGPGMYTKRLDNLQSGIFHRHNIDGIIPASYYSTGQGSLLWRGWWSGGMVGSTATLCGWHKADGNPVPFKLTRQGASPGNDAALRMNWMGSDLTIQNVVPPTRYMTPLQFVGTGGGNHLPTIYDGATALDHKIAPSDLVFTADPVFLASAAITNSNSNTGGATMAIAWNRALSADEVAWLDAEPYAMFIPPGPKVTYIPLYLSVAAGVAAATGTVQAQSVNTNPPAPLPASAVARAPAASASVNVPAMTATATATATGASIVFPVVDPDPEILHVRNRSSLHIQE